MLHAGLEAKRTLLQLTQLLVAHGHVVEDLQRDELVALAPGQVNDVQHAVRFLQKQQGIVILFLLYVNQGTLVQLEKHERDFV